jgi:hypothetical protein
MGAKKGPWTAAQTEAMIRLRLEGLTLRELTTRLRTDHGLDRDKSSILAHFNVVATDEQKRLAEAAGIANQAKGRADSLAQRQATLKASNAKRAADKAARALGPKDKFRSRIRYLTSWTAPLD